MVHNIPINFDLLKYQNGSLNNFINSFSQSLLPDIKVSSANFFQFLIHKEGEIKTIEIVSSDSRVYDAVDKQLPLLGNFIPSKKGNESFETFFFACFFH